MTKRAVVVGGGLAGLAAAIRLAEQGWTPIVLETRKRLGGRATSFVDPKSGATLDNCQHVLLGCCTNLIDFYRRIEVESLIEWHETLYWTRGGGTIDLLRANWMPAPLHLSSAFNRLSLFDRRQRREIARGMWAMIRLGTATHEASSTTFADLLREWGQSDAVIRDFWNTVIVSACNLDVWQVSARYALQVFQEGFLANRDAYVMGLSTVPLERLYDPAARSIEQAGGEIRTGVSVSGLVFDGSTMTGVETREGVVDADAVVVAVPPDRLHTLTTDDMRRADARLDGIEKVTCSPILGVHVQYEQAVMPEPHLVLVDMGTHWLFNRGVAADGSQWIHAVISAADAWMELDEATIIDRVADDIRNAYPAIGDARPTAGRAIKEKRATFAPVPGVDAFRPDVAPMSGAGISNLYIAGDWTNTGWPATMEGAVRSGYAAAAACSAHGGIVDDIPSAWLARRLGLKPARV
ncbi:MAG: hydroxysqualene dehydroxylase HpnE [Planctomycetota bacterium]